MKEMNKQMFYLLFSTHYLSNTQYNLKTLESFFMYRICYSNELKWIKLIHAFVSEHYL